MTAGVGADVENLCTKCGDVWHVVVAKVGDAIAKVQCKECGSVHRHRPPGGKAKPVSRRSATSKSTTSRARAKAEPPKFEPAIAADLSKPIRPYSIREVFAPGERIDHPKFGIGTVEESPAEGKIQVFFPDGRKILAQAKAGSGSGLKSMNAARPAWLDSDASD